MHLLEMGCFVAQGLALVAPAARIIIDLKKDKPLTTWEKAAITTESLFICFRFMDLGFQSANLLAPQLLSSTCQKMDLDTKKVELGLSLAAGATETTQLFVRQISDEQDPVISIASVLAIACFNISNSADKFSRLNLTPQIKHLSKICQSGTTCSGVAFYLGAVSYRIYHKREKIYQASQIIFELMRGKKDQLPIYQFNFNLEDPEENAQELDLDHQALILKMLNWKALKEIPKEFQEDEEFSKHQCKLSLRPIRRALRVLDKNEPTNILYDQYQLDAWMEEHVDEIPPEWPSNLIFKPHHLLVDRQVQKSIDYRLMTIAKVLKSTINT